MSIDWLSEDVTEHGIAIEEHHIITTEQRTDYMHHVATPGFHLSNPSLYARYSADMEWYSPAVHECDDEYF